MSGTEVTEASLVSFERYSNDFAGKAIKKAFGEMKRDILISLWCEDITKSAVHLAGTYEQFTQKLYGSVISEAVEKYTEHYALVHHLIPWADRLLENIVIEALKLHQQCETLWKQVFEDVKVELEKLERFKKVEKWADEKAALIIVEGMSSHIYGERYDKNCSPVGDGDPCELYAQSLVQDLFSSLRVKEHATTTITISTSSQSDKSKSSYCGSCESISSDLLSPHSTADSRGLYHFADKLLYSLSELENRSTESISSTDTTDTPTKFSIVDCLRRSSAPELRVSSRKSSLKTVIEEMPVRCPGGTIGGHKLKSYPSTSLGRRLRSSDDRRCASMEHIDDKSSYSDTLAKNILFSVYNDLV